MHVCNATKLLLLIFVMQYTAILLLKTTSFLFIWTDEGDLKYHNEVISDVTGVVVSGPITSRKPTFNGDFNF